MTLVAYTIGLVPFVLIRSVVAPFLARGDTATPVKAVLTGTAVNIVFKIVLMVPLAQVGLALATSIGAWINFILVLFFAARAHVIAVDAELKSSLWKLAVAGIALAIVLLIADPLVTALLSSWSRFRSESELALLALLGGLVYGGLVIVLFGRRWLALMRRSAQTAPAATLDELEGTSSSGRRAGSGVTGTNRDARDHDRRRICRARFRGLLCRFRPPGDLHRQGCRQGGGAQSRRNPDLRAGSRRSGRSQYAAGPARIRHRHIAHRRRRGRVHRGRHAVAPRRRPRRSELRL